MNGKHLTIQRVLLLLLLLACCASLTSDAAQPVPRGKVPTPGKVAAKKPFVVQETYREQTPYEDQKGIVGLDMLIEPERYPVVQRVFKGTPAYTEGVRSGDVILAINGVRAVNKSMWEVDKMISDIPGDVVNLTVMRDGQLRKFNLTVMPINEASAAVQNSFSGFVP